MLCFLAAWEQFRLPKTLLSPQGTSNIAGRNIGVWYFVLVLFVRGFCAFFFLFFFFFLVGDSGGKGVSH